MPNGHQQSTSVTLRTKFGSHCYNFVTCHNVSSGFEIWRHLPLFCRQWSFATTINEIVTTSKRLETASHGMETSKKWGLICGLQRNLNGITTNKLLFCRHKILSMLKICRRTRRIIPAVCDRYRIRQRLLTATHDDWREIQNCIRSLTYLAVPPPHLS